MDFDPQNLMSDAGMDGVSSFFQPDYASSPSKGSLGMVAGDQEILKDLNNMFGEDNRSMGQSTCGCASGCGCGNCQCATGGKGNESSEMVDAVSKAMENVRSIAGQSRPEFTGVLQQIESGLLQALAKPGTGSGQQ